MICSSFRTKSTFFCVVSEARTALWLLQASLALSYESFAVMNFRQEFPTRCQLSPQTFSGMEGTQSQFVFFTSFDFLPSSMHLGKDEVVPETALCNRFFKIKWFLSWQSVTWQRDALLVARFPLTVLVHSAALAAGLLVAHVWRVVLGTNVKLPYGPLGEKMKCYFIISFMKRKHLADSWDFHQKIEMFFWT